MMKIMVFWHIQQRIFLEQITHATFQVTWPPLKKIVELREYYSYYKYY